ncbi:DUF1176 domain-containing protein [Eleftheria terrae]|uniref:DUF1176 domain-containing protein n=1 Tax=Eleftheria terrae TaxID=1597781 RepID=UPI00263A77AD|nr:DUF1176 domain-containing protein [Eleftheria terrae]WKB53986.1 DUF1176 domain-containing protein [Eleftheria terrae]
MKLLAVMCCLLGSSWAAAATLAAPVYKGFGDWLVGCDNVGDCEALAAAAEPQRLTLRIQQPAGPAGRLTVRLEGDERFSVTDLQLDGRPLGLDAAGWQVSSDGQGEQPFEIASRSPAAAADFLARVRNGQLLSYGSGDARGAASLSGLSAALLLIDEKQGRLGTAAALLRRGSKPASSVPAAAPVPPAPAASPVPPGLDERQGRALIAAVRRSQAGLLKEVDCEAPGSPGMVDEADALDAREALVSLACWAGAYQTSSLLFRVQRAAPHAAQRLVLKSPLGSRYDHLTNVSYDPGTGVLQHFAKGRGVADCGESAEWQFDGRDFVMTRFSYMDRCAGLRPELWFELWRTGAPR